MSAMTFKDLLDKLSLMTEDQLRGHIVVHDMVEDEFYGSSSGITLEVAGADHQVLDEDHLVICVRK